jgi:uncharacterized protein YecE (DUF72 family)
MAPEACWWFGLVQPAGRTRIGKEWSTQIPGRRASMRQPSSHSSSTRSRSTRRSTGRRNLGSRRTGHAGSRRIPGSASPRSSGEVSPTSATPPQDESQFKAGIDPLVEAGRLGALLLQFPWSFKNEEKNRAYLFELQRRFREYPLVLEVRHASWNQPAVLDMLADLGIGLCNIDQPLFAKSIKPASHATSPVGYIRLHGRNYQNWFTENQQTGDRYNYLYSLDELEPWVERAKIVSDRAEDTYVVTNNHFLGKAVVNAFELTSLLFERPVQPPDQLRERYPVLEQVQRHNRAPAIGSPVARSTMRPFEWR